MIDEPKLSQQTVTTKDHAPTLAAIGVLAYLGTVPLAHEALGHGVACLASGGHFVLYPVSIHCTAAETRVNTAAGPLMNFVLGTGLWVILRIVHSWSPRLRYFLWLTTVFNWLNGAAYLLVGALTLFGDWPIVLQNSQLPWLWRFIAVPLAGVLYYLFMRQTASLGSEYLSPVRSLKAAREHTLVPYLAAGCVACAAAAFSRVGMRYVLVAAGTSFGANCGLVVIHYWRVLHYRHYRAAPALAAGPIPRVTRSFAWITVALIVAAFFIVCLGPGLHVP